MTSPTTAKSYLSASIEPAPPAAADAPVDEDRAAEPPAYLGFQRVTQLLRLAGAVVLIAAAGAFLIQEWGTASHVVRYLLFLGFTAVLTASGFVCGLRLGDDRSARTFLAVAAAIIPAHFCQLGALLFSEFGRPNDHYPQYLLWSSPGLAPTLMLTAVGTISLGVIAYISFAALARPLAGRFTLAYIAANAVLLLPTRNPDVQAFLAAALFLGGQLVDWRAFACGAVRTREGLFARLMLLVPLVLLLGRMFLLYEPASLFIGTAVALVAAWLQESVKHYRQERETIAAAQAASLVPAGIAWLLIYGAIVRDFAVPVDLEIPFFGLPIAGLLVLFGLNSINSGRGHFIAATMAAAATGLLQLTNYTSLSSSLFCTALGIVTSAAAYGLKSRAAFFFGVLAFVVAIFYHLRWAVELCTLSPWLNLGVIGILTVLSAAVIDRHQASLSAGLQRFRSEFKEWRA